MKTIATALTAFMFLNSIFIFGQPGSIDSSFGNNGKAKTSLLPGSSSMAIQANGKILVEYNFNVLRFNKNGKLDRTFGINGKASTFFVGDSHGYLLALEPDELSVFKSFIKEIIYSFSFERSPKYSL